jgi:hypothetical protein
MRQRLRPRAPSGGEATEPPVYPADMRLDTPPRCYIPLQARSVCILIADCGFEFRA